MPARSRRAVHVRSDENGFVFGRQAVKYVLVGELVAEGHEVSACAGSFTEPLYRRRLVHSRRPHLEHLLAPELVEAGMNRDPMRNAALHRDHRSVPLRRLDAAKMEG